MISNKIQVKGSTLLEVLASLAVISLVAVAGANLADINTQNVKDQEAANFQKMVADASQKYILSNSTKIAATSTSTSPAVILFSDLKSAGYIPAQYLASSTNVYRQTPCTLVLQPSSGTLKALVLTEGGDVIPTGRLNSIAKSAGLNGGYIDPADTTKATGNIGNWTEPLTNYLTKNCSGVNASANHLASFISFDNGILKENYLYRNAVAGHPEANTMKTPLIIGAIKSITDSCLLSEVGSIAQDGSGALVSCDSVTLKYKAVGGDGNAYWKDAVTTYASLPTCAALTSGQTRAVIANSRGAPAAYICNGASWNAIGVDDSGVFNVDKLMTLTSARVRETKSEYSSCLLSELGTVLKEVNLSGVLVCQRDTFGATTYSYRLAGSTDWLPPVTLSTDLAAYPKTIGSKAMVTSTLSPYAYISAGLGWQQYYQGVRIGLSTTGTSTSRYSSTTVSGKASIDSIKISKATATTAAAVTATATCNSYNFVTGFCTGDVDGVGQVSYQASPFLNNGWVCTSKAVIGSAIKATALCGTTGEGY